RERLSRAVVVIENQNMIVRLLSPPIHMTDDEAVGIRVHLLRELVAQIVHPLHVFGVLRVELLVAGRLAVVQRLALARGVRMPRASYSRAGSPDRSPAARVRGSSGRTPRR